jgi:hypothetical protein
MPANLTTLAHLSISSRMSFPNSAGELAKTHPPTSRTAFTRGTEVRLIFPRVACLRSEQALLGGNDAKPSGRLIAWHGSRGAAIPRVGERRACLARIGAMRLERIHLTFPRLRPPGGQTSRLLGRPQGPRKLCGDFKGGIQGGDIAHKGSILSRCVPPQQMLGG